jgi:hypothetical protein
MKKFLILAALAVTTVAQATTCTLFNNYSGYNNSYNCSFPSSSIGANQQVSSCTFTFTSCNSWYPSGSLYCNLLGSGSTWTCGSQSSSTSTWNCTLNNSCLTYLNNCLTSGSCNFNLNCYGGWNVGSCTVDYTCTPKPHTVPDTATTVLMLGLALIGIEFSRRKLAVAKN